MTDDMSRNMQVAAKASRRSRPWKSIARATTLIDQATKKSATSRGRRLTRLRNKSRRGGGRRALRAHLMSADMGAKAWVLTGFEPLEERHLGRDHLAPWRAMRATAASLLSARREPMASRTTDTWRPRDSSPSTVWSTQTCASQPATTIARSAGKLSRSPGARRRVKTHLVDDRSSARKFRHGRAEPRRILLGQQDGNSPARPPRRRGAGRWRPRRRRPRWRA